MSKSKTRISWLNFYLRCKHNGYVKLSHVGQEVSLYLVRGQGEKEYPAVITAMSPNLVTARNLVTGKQSVHRRHDGLPIEREQRMGNCYRLIQASR